MLRSYQYTQRSYLGYSMQDDAFHTKETEFARLFVESHDIRHDMGMKCPICCQGEGRYYFNKWNVDYLRCDKCGSIYAVCEEDTLNQYMSYERLNDFRLSPSYQEQMTKSRYESWKEYIEWVEVRAFRFLSKNTDLVIGDIGNRLSGFVELIRKSGICGSYYLIDSILKDSIVTPSEGFADIVFCNDVIKTDYDPHKRVREIRNYLNNNGLLFMGARAGSGFDIITLKENNTRICPYEHVLLPSVKGMMKLLGDNGFEVLEITTPGVMDVKYVMDDIDKLDGREEFVRRLLLEGNEATLQEFQRFLQKNCMSSYVRVIARKAKENEAV